MGDWFDGSTGGARQQREDAEPIQSAVVLSGPPGNVGVLRSLDGRGRVAGDGDRRLDGDSLYRFQQKGKWLLHHQRAQVCLSDVSVRVSGPVGDADRDGDIFARAEL